MNAARRLFPAVLIVVVMTLALHAQEPPAKRGWVGVQLDEAEEGVTVVMVVPGGPAEKGGIEAGDVILEYDGEALGAGEDALENFTRIGMTRKEGQKVTFTVLRKGKKIKKEVTLGERPAGIPAPVGPDQHDLEGDDSAHVPPVRASGTGSGGGGAAAPSTAWNFDKEDLGSTPAGFQFARTGEGEEGKWEVRRDPEAPSAPMVLVQASEDDSDNRFPLALAPASAFRDGLVRVRFRPIRGTKDQAGGLAVRFQDRDNYLLVRANALEGNVRLYRVVKGVREQLATTDMQVAADAWHTLEVTLTGDKFKATLDGKPAGEATDTKFSGSGGVGLWTKSDSVTAFDDLVVEAR